MMGCGFSGEREVGYECIGYGGAIGDILDTKNCSWDVLYLYVIGLGEFCLEHTHGSEPDC